MATVSSSPFHPTSRTMPRSTTETAGISGSGTSASQPQTCWAVGRVAGVMSPGRIRVGALQELHLGEEIAEMLAVQPALAAALHPAPLGPLQRLLLEGAAHMLQPGLAQGREVGRHALPDQLLFDRVHLEHLARVGPERAHRLLHPAPALLGAVAEPDHPVTAALEVVGDLLDR